MGQNGLEEEVKGMHELKPVDAPESSADGEDDAGSAANEEEEDERFWSRVRDEQFPGAKLHAGYLNASVAGIVSRDAVDAFAAATANWAEDPARAVYDTGALNGAREKLARLLRCEVEQVGLTMHTSDGINIAAHLLQSQCDEVVCFDDEFPTGPIAFMNQGKPVSMITVADVTRAGGGLLDALAARVEALLGGAKEKAPRMIVVVLSAASYMDGHEIDIYAAGDLCASRGVPLIVDASQALGVKLLDMSAAPGVCVLAAPTYKWLNAGPGMGVIYLSKDMLRRFPSSAPFAGWFGQAVDGRNWELGNKADAARFLVGTPALTLLPGLCAALDLIESVGGIAAVERRVGRLAARLRRGLLAAGFALAGAFGVPLRDVQGCGDGHIVGVIIQGDASAVAAALGERGFSVTAKNRHGFCGLRVAPHVYNTETECDAFVRALSEVCAQRSCGHLERPTAEYVPTLIDIGVSEADGARAAELAENVDAALRVHGFFFVKNHGVSAELLQRMWKYTAAFHALPLAEKEALRNPSWDGKGSNLGYRYDSTGARFENAFPESCALAAENRWPEETAGSSLVGFRSACSEYARATNALGLRVLRLLETAMGGDVAAEHLLSRNFDEPQSAINLRFYAEVPANGAPVCCVKPHTDSGVLTFLPQQSKPGFEMCTTEGRWVPVMPPDDGDSWILVQVGDCLRRWSNLRYTSLLHRVVPHRGRGDRYAMPVRSIQKQ